MTGLEFTATKVPVPTTNPVGPYSIFHAVSEPPTVQERSKELDVILLATKLLGVRHGGAHVGLQLPKHKLIIVSE